MLIVFWPFCEKTFALSELKVESSVISAPATKAFSPAPVSIKTLISSFFEISSRASENSLSRSSFKALSALGLLKVIVAIPSSVLKIMFSYAMFFLHNLIVEFVKLKFIRF